jgi:hypothetical protein
MLWLPVHGLPPKWLGDRRRATRQLPTPGASAARQLLSRRLLARLQWAGRLWAWLQWAGRPCCSDPVATVRKAREASHWHAAAAVQSAAAAPHSAAAATQL